MNTGAKNLIALTTTTIIVAGCFAYVNRVTEWNKYISALGQLRWETRSRAKLIYLATEIYALDNDEHLPPMQSQAEWRSLMHDYGAKELDSSNPTGGSFMANPRVAGQCLQSLKERKIIIAFEEKPWRQGERAFLFADGTVAFLSSVTTESVGGARR